MELFSFYDIVTLADAMGLNFKLVPGRGPVPDQPIRSLADVEALDARPAPDRYGYILDLLHRVKKELNGELPVLFFAGAPFTVASYCLGTGKNTVETRKFIAEQPVAWEMLLDKLQSATIEFLNVMAREGGQFYQLFDSWAGELTRDEYHRWALPQHRAIFANAKEVPRAIFVKETPYTARTRGIAGLMWSRLADAKTLPSCGSVIPIRSSKAMSMRNSSATVPSNPSLRPHINAWRRAAGPSMS